MSTPDEIIDVVERLRRDQLTLLDLIAAHDWRDTGYPSLPRYLRDLLHVTPRVAKQLAAQVDAVCPTISSTGVPLPPRLPRVRAALADGALDDRHVAAVIATMKRVPEWVDANERDRVEKSLVESCRIHDPAVVRRIGAHLLATLKRERPEPPPLTSPSRTGLDVDQSAHPTAAHRRAGQRLPATSAQVPAPRPHEATPTATPPREPAAALPTALARPVTPATAPTDSPHHTTSTTTLTPGASTAPHATLNVPDTQAQTPAEHPHEVAGTADLTPGQHRAKLDPAGTSLTNSPCQATNTTTLAPGAIAAPHAALNVPAALAAAPAPSPHEAADTGALTPEPGSTPCTALGLPGALVPAPSRNPRGVAGTADLTPDQHRAALDLPTIPAQTPAPSTHGAANTVALAAKTGAAQPAALDLAVTSGTAAADNPHHATSTTALAPGASAAPHATLNLPNPLTTTPAQSPHDVADTADLTTEAGTASRAALDHPGTQAQAPTGSSRDVADTADPTTDSGTAVPTAPGPRTTPVTLAAWQGAAFADLIDIARVLATEGDDHSHRTAADRARGGPAADAHRAASVSTAIPALLRTYFGTDTDQGPDAARTTPTATRLAPVDDGCARHLGSWTDGGMATLPQLPSPCDHRPIHGTDWPLGRLALSPPAWLDPHRRSRADNRGRLGVLLRRPPGQAMCAHTRHAVFRGG